MCSGECVTAKHADPVTNPRNIFRVTRVTALSYNITQELVVLCSIGVLHITPVSKLDTRCGMQATFASCTRETRPRTSAARGKKLRTYNFDSANIEML